MTLEGSIEDNYDTRIIRVKPKGLTPLMASNIFTCIIGLCAAGYFAASYGNLPMNIIVPMFSIVAVGNFALLMGTSRFQLVRGKQELEKLFRE